MKTYSQALFLFIILFLISSCSTHTHKAKYYEVKNYKPRASSLGFSIVPPPGENWYEKLKNDSLYYLKISKSHKRYSILTEAREVRLKRSFKSSDELVDYVKHEKENSLLPVDFKNGKVSVRLETSLSKYCVRYSKLYEDHGVKGLRGRRFVNVDTQGLFCLHPGNEQVGVDVSYVEKSLSDTKAESYRNEGELFLASLNFQEIQNN